MKLVWLSFLCITLPFTLQQKFSDSKSIRISQKLYLDSSTIYTGKCIWVSCVLVLTQTVFSCLRMDVNPHKFYWKLPWTTEQFLSILCLLQLLIKEIVLHWLLQRLFTKTRKISPESPYLRYPVSFADSYSSGFVSNPKTFYTGYVTSV